MADTAETPEEELPALEDPPVSEETAAATAPAPAPTTNTSTLPTTGGQFAAAAPQAYAGYQYATPQYQYAAAAPAAAGWLSAMPT